MMIFTKLNQVVLLHFCFVLFKFTTLTTCLKLFKKVIVIWKKIQNAV